MYLKKFLAPVGLIVADVVSAAKTDSPYVG